GESPRPGFDLVRSVILLSRRRQRGIVLETLPHRGEKKTMGAQASGGVGIGRPPTSRARCFALPSGGARPAIPRKRVHSDLTRQETDSCLLTPDSFPLASVRQSGQ